MCVIMCKSIVQNYIIKFIKLVFTKLDIPIKEKTSSYLHKMYVIEIQ